MHRRSCSRRCTTSSGTLPYDERSNGYAKLKPVVILDIDETMLGNSAYEARLVEQHKEYDEASFDEWLKEEKDRPLPGALAFTQFAARHGVRVFYITNRVTSSDRATIDDLRKLSFPMQPGALLGLGTYVNCPNPCTFPG